MEYFLTIFIIPYQVFFSRATGGFIKLPWKLEHIFYGLPYGLICYALAGPYWGLIGMFWATLIKITGHGQWMSLPYSVKNIEPEKLDFLLWPFFGEDPRTIDQHISLDKRIQKYGSKKLFYRNLAGLFTNSLVLGLGVSALLIDQGYVLEALWFTLVHALTPLGYALGWFVFKDRETEWGEAFRGFFSGMSLAGIYFTVIL